MHETSFHYKVQRDDNSYFSEQQGMTNYYPDVKMYDVIRGPQVYSRVINDAVARRNV